MLYKLQGVIYFSHGDIMEIVKQNNYLKYLVLDYMSDGKERCVFDVSDKMYDVITSNINPTIEHKNQLANIGMALMRYALKYASPILSRERIGARFYYKITDVGHERLKQMKAAHRFFGVYRLKHQRIKLLIKTKTGNYAVNSEILPYAPLFCDVPVEKLQMYVGLL